MQYAFIYVQIFYTFYQGWGAGAGYIWLLGAGAAWKKTRSRSRLEKKVSKKLAGSSALREDKKHKEVVL